MAASGFPYTSDVASSLVMGKCQNPFLRSCQWGMKNLRDNARLEMVEKIARDQNQPNRGDRGERLVAPIKTGKE